MTLNNHNKDYRNIQFPFYFVSPCSAHNGLYQNVPLCGLRRREEAPRGREGANYSNNNDNIVNLARIIISINLDQEWGMPKINSNDNL